MEQRISDEYLAERIAEQDPGVKSEQCKVELDLQDCRAELANVREALQSVGDILGEYEWATIADLVGLVKNRMTELAASQAREAASRAALEVALAIVSAEKFQGGMKGLVHEALRQQAENQIREALAPSKDKGAVKP